MSDARIIWKLSVALMCAQGAWLMQLLSGVRDDGKESSVRDGVADDAIFRGLSGNSQDCRTAMKGPNEDRGQVIDFFDARCRRDWALYARRTGRADQAPMRHE